MIPAEALEAAAKAITARYGDPVRRWKQDVDDARVALEAAAPHMLADAWDEGEGVGFDEGRGDIGPTPNPYRPPRGNAN